LTLSKAFIDYSTSGLENPLTHMLLCGFLFVGIVLQVNTPRLFVLSLVAALGAVNRLDTLCLFLPLLIRTMSLSSAL
jgi:arabinofuranosyltransferase